MHGFLRSIREDELELIRSWRNAPKVRIAMYTQHEITRDEHAAWWKSIQLSQDKKYFICEYAQEKIGVVCFTNIDTKNKHSSWGFYPSTEARKGSGVRIETIALDYAFYKLNLNKLYCDVLSYNNSVINLHQKAGFKIEGLFRHQYKMDDVFIDVYRFGILSSEWRAHREIFLEKLERFSRERS